jgi:hypothetical protein
MAGPNCGGWIYKATPEDIPLKPGESCTLKFPEQDVAGWESVKSEGVASDPLKILLMSTEISFGDGTGFSRTDGKPFPGKAGSCYPQRKSDDTRAANDALPDNSLSQLLQLTSFVSPVNFLPANFLVTKTSGNRMCS